MIHPLFFNLYTYWFIYEIWPHILRFSKVKQIYSVSNYTIPSLQIGSNGRLVFKRSNASLNSVFLLPDWLPKEANLSYYLSKLEGRRDRLIPFPRKLTRREQKVSSRIWTQSASIITVTLRTFKKEQTSFRV